MLDNISQEKPPASEIEIIGNGLFGNTWKAQIAQFMSILSHEPLSRGAIGSWHNRDKIPNKYKPFIRQMAALRLQQIQRVSDIICLDQSTIDQCIDHFIDINADSITPKTKIYTRLRYGLDAYRNLILKPEIVISRNDSPCDLTGWQPFFINDFKFQRQMIMLRGNLQKQFATSIAVHDHTLDTPDSASYSIPHLSTDQESGEVCSINLAYQHRKRQTKRYISLVA
jgi:hypothetical protein